MGLIEEAPVEYQSADGVPCAGVLLGLALLEDTHLVEEARAVYGRLEERLVRLAKFALDAGRDGLAADQASGTTQAS